MTEGVEGMPGVRRYQNGEVCRRKCVSTNWKLVLEIAFQLDKGR